MGFSEIANESIKKAPPLALGAGIIITCLFVGSSWFLKDTGIDKALVRNLDAQTESTKAVTNMTGKVEALTQSVDALARTVRDGRTEIADIKEEVNTIRRTTELTKNRVGELESLAYVKSNQGKDK